MIKNSTGLYGVMGSSHHSVINAISEDEAKRKFNDKFINEEVVSVKEILYSQPYRI